MSEIITLAHGSGGKLTHKLISDIFQKHFCNDLLLESGDSAVFKVKEGRMAFTTDSYVITPVFFKGGNIGKLSVCGTVNDLAAGGAKPLYMSCGFIIEEGFEISKLESIVQAMALTASEAGVRIVAGDTKVVQRGGADKIFINTAGIGIVPDCVSISPSRIEGGDKVIITGTVGDHGTAILLEREGFPIKSGIESDCAPLNTMLEEICTRFANSIHVMRDPTRGGVATTLNEFVAAGPLGIKLYEESIPVKGEVKGICDMLGMDPLYMANEGKMLIIVRTDAANDVLELLKQHKYGKDASIIGEVNGVYPGKVYMETLTGGNRIIDMLVGDQLPRIC